MRIALYGGSFNPPHLGHERVARLVSEVLHPDKLLIIPDNIPPHKNLSANAPSPLQRFEMCKIAFSGIPNCEISDMELNRGGKSYTVDTLKEFKASHPDDTLFLIMGMDMIESFSTWYQPEEIESMCTLFVAPREISSESSSVAREQLSKEHFSPMLSDSINKYVKETNLY